MLETFFASKFGSADDPRCKSFIDLFNKPDPGSAGGKG